MPVSPQTYHVIALEDPEGQWELHRGRLREKPVMSSSHNEAMSELGFLLRAQLDPALFLVRINTGRVKRADEVYYIPDVYVVRRDRLPSERTGALETYEGPLPLVVEVCSPSTGGYDVDTKFPEYQTRQDREIWRAHPVERTITVWIREESGTYRQSIHRDGQIFPSALPGVVINV